MDEAGVTGEWGVERVLALVTALGLRWRGASLLRPSKELRFTYEEEADPEQFFLPYIWALVVGRYLAGMPWDTARIALFVPAGAGEGEGGSVDGAMNDLGALVDGPV